MAVLIRISLGYRVRGAVVLHGLVISNEPTNFVVYFVSCFPAVLWVTDRVTGNLTCREPVRINYREIMCMNRSVITEVSYRSVLIGVSRGVLIEGCPDRGVS